MDSPPKIEIEKTVNLELNDDCLLGVFKNFNLCDLCVVADVCSRFRRAAKDHFEHSKTKELTFPCDVQRYHGSRNFFIVRMCKMLRNFDEFIINFNMKENRMFSGDREKQRFNYEDRIVELLVRHCSQKLIGLKWSQLHLTDDVVLTMRSLFEQLQTLEFMAFECSELLLNMLPEWCTNLRELKFSGTCLLKSNGLPKAFQNFEAISMVGISNVRFEDIEQFIKYNSQLKRIAFEVSDNVCVNHILKSIVECASAVENLHINFNGSTVSSRYFVQLTNLHSLTLQNSYGLSMVAAIHYMVEARIPIKYLCLTLKCTHITNYYHFVQNNIEIGQTGNIAIKITQRIGSTLHERYLQII